MLHVHCMQYIDDIFRVISSFPYHRVCFSSRAFLLVPYVRFVAIIIVQTSRVNAAKHIHIFMYLLVHKGPFSEIKWDFSAVKPPWPSAKCPQSIFHCKIFEKKKRKYFRTLLSILIVVAERDKKNFKSLCLLLLLHAFPTKWVLRVIFFFFLLLCILNVLFSALAFACWKK